MTYPEGALFTGQSHRFGGDIDEGASFRKKDLPQVQDHQEAWVNTGYL